MKFSVVSRAIAALALSASSTLVGLAQQAPTLDLTQPGREYTSVLMGTGPSMTVFNNSIYLAFLSNSGDNTLWITNSTTAGAFTNPGINLKNIVMLASTAPAIAYWSNKLWIFYTGTTGNLYYISSSDGKTFTSPLLVEIGNFAQQSSSQPTLAVFQNNLWVAWVQNGSGSATNAAYAVTSNGTSFQSAAGCIYGPDGEQPQTGAAIGISPYLDHVTGATELGIAFQAQGDWNHQLITCSSNGSAVTAYSNSTDQAGSGVAAAFFDGYLYWAYKELSGDNVLYVNGSWDDVTLNPILYSGIETNGRQNIAPATVVFNNTYYLGYTENSGTHHLWVATAPLP